MPAPHAPDVPAGHSLTDPTSQRPWVSAADGDLLLRAVDSGEVGHQQVHVDVGDLLQSGQGVRRG